MESSHIKFTPILMHFAARFTGKSYAEFASDYRVLAEANLRCMEYFDTDMAWLISDPYRETSAFGAPLEYVPEGVPKCLKNIVKSIEDVHALKIPDVYKSERTLDRIKAAELLSRELKGKKSLIGWIEGPLAEACDLTGMAEIFTHLMLDPAFCEYLMDKCMEVAKTFALAQIEAGCDIIGIGDAVCSQIDEETYYLYVKERHQELFTFIRSKGAQVKLHICGDISHLLHQLCELPIDYLDLDWQVDMDFAYNHTKDKIIRCGNLNPVIIQNARPEELDNLARSLIAREKNRAFILQSGCEVPVLTPPGNLLILSNSRFKKSIQEQANPHDI